MAELFVDLPGVVEIIRVNEDLKYRDLPTDLFNEQKIGLPKWTFGSGRKTAVEKAFFFCRVCKIALESVPMLRTHCIDTSHQTKVKEDRESEDLSEYELKVEDGTKLKCSRRAIDSSSLLSGLTSFSDPKDQR